MPDRLDEGLQMSGERHTVVFQPTGVRTEVESGERLRAAALAAGVEIRSLCGERINCGKCRVVLQSGNYERLGIRSSLENASRCCPGKRLTGILGGKGWQLKGMTRIRSGFPARYAYGATW
jgi:uncharacterized 2Fe-2S/4Fe-4S cluster protein (DUF4445 family)